MPDENWWGYKVRAAVSAPHLRGRGLEIGAGGFPQALPQGATALYFDKSDSSHLARQFNTEITYEVHPMREIRQFFPNGADFLIAHNVLEHTPSEIRTLIEWNGYVRDGGIVVLSVPDKDYTLGDKRRLSTPPEHLLFDYLFGRNERSFESLEHVFGFMLGWDDAKWTDAWRELDRDRFVDKLLTAPYEETHDFHWHALDREAWDFVVSASALLGGRSLDVISITDPSSEGEWQPQGEIIYVYKLGSGRAVRGMPDFSAELRRTRTALVRAAETISF